MGLIEIPKKMAEAWVNFSFLIVCPDLSSPHISNLKWHIFAEMPDIMDVSDASVEKIFDTFQFRQGFALKEFLPIWKQLPIDKQNHRLADFIEKLKALHH